MSVLAFDYSGDFDPHALQPSLQAALIQMTESHVRRTLVRHLTEDMQCGPSVRTYQELVARGLAELRPGAKWHSLTPAGREHASKLVPWLCRYYDIHLLQEGGSIRYAVVFKCPCGWRTEVPKGNFTNKTARFRFAQHLEQAASEREPRFLKMLRGEAS